ncbi:hypothetical protein QNH39_23145 [Neobacillus novalis]|uniref:Uncharacterized protein n=1 Tax=Neobacillus novalis TaxID=220687 RepID=A0AA95MKA6_9BACI|nr:hypothetical protein [Neobacillus novalis]WHY85477.1 hypothetical protein QNH39_23145 [Neobacillus novalis]
MEYQTIFYGGLAGAILSLMISIILFIKLNISEVIEDLTGFSFHKWVKKLKAHSRSKREQSIKPITREIQPRRDVELEVAASGEVDATELLAVVADDETELLASADADATELLTASDPDATEILAAADADAAELLAASNADVTEFLAEADADATELLAAADTKVPEFWAAADTDETELLEEAAAETELLAIGIDETVLLDEEIKGSSVLTGPASESKFIIERDVVIVHTNAAI